MKLHRGILVALIVGLGFISRMELAAQPVRDKQLAPEAPPLLESLKKANLVLVGKVTEVGLGVASSFDVGRIEVREVLKGKADTKTVLFRFASSGGGRRAPYGKVGVEGVWVLDNRGDAKATCGVLSFQPLTELNAIKKLLAKQAEDKSK
jgi:hypothetical protein